LCILCWKRVPSQKRPISGDKHQLIKRQSTKQLIMIKFVSPLRYWAFKHKNRISNPASAHHVLVSPALLDRATGTTTPTRSPPYRWSWHLAHPGTVAFSKIFCSVKFKIFSILVIAGATTARPTVLVSFNLAHHHPLASPIARRIVNRLWRSPLWRPLARGPGPCLSQKPQQPTSFSVSPLIKALNLHHTVCTSTRKHKITPTPSVRCLHLLLQ
jgi:hypothetical protein